MKEKKDILISIVNGNNKGFIYDCVASISRFSEEISFDIVVIDNCTGDKNLNKLEERGIQVIRNSEPLGFSQNHAQILPFIADYNYLLIFNDDAFLLNNSFKIMKDCLDDDPSIAIAGCRINGSAGELQPSCAPFPTIKYFFTNLFGLGKKGKRGYSVFFDNYIDYERTQDVDWVSGCCMLIRTSFINTHGFLDPVFFMFLEDTDICRRARFAGFRVLYVSEAKILHYGGGSSKVDSKDKTIRPFLFIEKQRSRLSYLKKTSFVQYITYMITIYVYLFLKMSVEITKGNYGWSKEVAKNLYKKLLF